MLPEVAQRLQPAEDSLVWQDNRLSEARYDLSAREQKMVLYAVAMIHAEDEAFRRYRINVREYAGLANLDANSLYAELRKTAKSIARKPLVVSNHLGAGANQPTELLTHWFAEVEFGDGYVDVTFPPSLKPYLLQVKRDFFRFELRAVLELKGAYAIRLYQWCKRWQFRKTQRINVAELRAVLGTVEVTAKGAVVAQRLPKYGDFKKWALDPALKEINQRTDLRLGYKEEKRRGTKLVETICFRIGESHRPLETVTLPPQAQMHLALEAAPPAAADPPGAPPEAPPCLPAPAVAGPPASVVDEVCAGFGLSLRQLNEVRRIAAERGADYVREKVEVVYSQPRENAARTFLAALRDDWKTPVQTRRAVKAKVPPPPQKPGPDGWREYLQRTYPEARVPAKFPDLTDSLQRECRQALGTNGSPARPG